MLIVPNSSEAIILGYMLNIMDPQDLVIRLFANNIIPADEDTVVSFQEVQGSGYQPQDLVPSSWTIVSGNPTEAKHREITWEFDKELGNVFGYYITRKDTGELMWAERFKDGPYPIDTRGDKIKVTPKLKLNNFVRMSGVEHAEE